MLIRKHCNLKKAKREMALLRLADKMHRGKKWEEWLTNLHAVNFTVFVLSAIQLFNNADAVEQLLAAYVAGIKRGTLSGVVGMYGAQSEGGVLDPIAQTSFLGVPDPTFGATLGNPTTVAKQTILSSWTTNAAGWYYVTSSGTNVGNGYPADPAALGSTMTLSAGDVLVMSGTFTGSSLTITCNGTEANPVWIINDGAVDIQRDTTIQGTYAMIDGVNWSNLQSHFLAFGSASSYICVRNGNAVGTGIHPAQSDAAIGTSGSPGYDNHHIVLFNLDVSYFGDYTDTGNIDIHAIKPRNNCSDIWILGCHLHHCGADGVQTGEASGVTGTDRPTRIYVAGCEMHHNRENGLDIKSSIDVVISENDLHDSQGLGDSGPPTEIVIHGQSSASVDGVYIIFNDIYNSSNGVYASAYSTSVYVVGNVIREITGATGDTYWGAGTCVNLNSAAGQSCYISNNTFYHYDKGVSVPYADTVQQISGNIFAGRNGNYFDIGIDATASVYATDDSNYNLFETARFYYDGIYYDGLAGLPNNFEQNSIQGAIGFTDAINIDFTLTAVSDGVNNGIKGDVYALYEAAIGVNIEKDKAGNDRPVTSTSYDIGAYERVAA